MTTILVNDPSGNPADNVARIKAAIAEANAKYLANPSGGQVTIQLGAGTWVVTGDKSNPSAGAIELLSGVALTGSGNRQTEIKLEDNFNARINGLVRTALDTVENVTISNLVIDGNRANNIGHQAGFISGVKAASGDTQTNITLDNVEARNFSAYGINPHEITYNLTITNSTAHHNGLDGFVADGVVSGVYENNVSYANDRHGFNIQNASQDIVLENNTAHSNGTGATGGAGIVVQRGDIQRDNEAEIAHVTNVQIIGGEYYGNTREGILVKLSDNVTISGANIHDNARQGVRIEGSINTVVKDSFISSNSQEIPGEYDEIQIRLRADYPDGNPDNNPSTNPIKNYYSTGTKILNNVINPEDARYAIREEPTNTAGGPTGTEISGNATGGIATDGNDTLGGSAGVDTMAGGKGDDTYIVNKDGDTITENPNEGIDHVLASAKHTLGANVENLTLTGSAAINGYGNELSNVLTGNAAANNLESFGGADTLSGGGGADTLQGGDGNDVYIVDNAGVLIVEKANGGLGGYDHVFASVDYTLSAQVEEITLTGTANLTAIGNTGSNTLNGNAGHNVLDGAGGADRMDGGLGNDTYYVDHSQDVVTEAAGEGIDTIVSSMSIPVGSPLVANVENLYLTDPANPQDPLAKWAKDGAGNQLNNLIVGNSTDNKLYGYGGDDTLTGGAGNDTLDGGEGNDTAQYSGNRANYTITGTGASKTIAGGTAGTDTLLNIEVLQFADGKLVGDTWVPNPVAPPPANAVLSSATVNLTETDAVLSTGGQLTITDPDSGEATVRVQTGTAGQYGTFAIGANGQWTYVASSAHNEFVQNQVYTDSFEVFSADGTRTTVTVNITGTNEVAPPPPPPPVNSGNEVVFRTGSARSETFIGSDNIDNVMKGLGGNDTLKGRGGNDRLYGGTGNDKVYGESGDDRVYGESGNDYVHGGSGNDYANGGSGNDRVYGSFGSDRVYGSSGHDTVDGGSGNDWVYGDSGNDRLYGGAGSDAFVFNSKLGTAATDRKVNFDTVVDFKVRDDSFLLDNAVFKKLGSGTLASPTQLDAEFFTSSGKARERDDYLVYNKKTGVLSYDADGSGRGAAVEFAQLSKNLSLTYKDFFVI